MAHEVQIQEKYEESQLYKIRHSAAHIMAQAVLEFYPETKYTIGPPVENGFYYDFELPEQITNEDLEKIEKRMRQIIAGHHEFKKEVISADEARVVFIEELSRAVETRQFAAPNALLAGNAVVDETANAATQLDQILAKLHGSLAPWQRRRLATRVRARYEDWRPAWKAGAYEEHAWLESIATDHLASSVDDARATARRWVDALLADVRAGEKLDDEGRRELVARLRQAGPK